MWLLYPFLADFGAAVAQLSLGALYTKESREGSSLEPKSPSPNGLPARPMSNLGMPFRVPIAAYTIRKTVSFRNSNGVSISILNDSFSSTSTKLPVEDFKYAGNEAVRPAYSSNSHDVVSRCSLAPKRTRNRLLPRLCIHMQ